MTTPATPDGASVAGLLLAAGAGRRLGGPKALLVDADGVPWLASRSRVLAGGGCRPVVVVLGAAADRARALLPAEALPVVADGWQAGMGASLHEGLRAVAALDPAPDAVVVCLVDTPGVSSDAVARLVPDAGPSSLAQATYGGRRGHPVLLGRDHWDGVRSVAVGDRGARDYLARHPVHLVECGDVADGYDVDTAEQARTVGARWAAGQRPPLSD